MDMATVDAALPDASAKPQRTPEVASTEATSPSQSVKSSDPQLPVCHSEDVDADGLGPGILGSRVHNRAIKNKALHLHFLEIRIVRLSSSTDSLSTNRLKA